MFIGPARSQSKQVLDEGFAITLCVGHVLSHSEGFPDAVEVVQEL